MQTPDRVAELAQQLTPAAAPAPQVPLPSVRPPWLPWLLPGCPLLLGGQQSGR